MRVAHTLADWQALLQPAHAALIADAAAIDAADVAALERVRVRHSAGRELMHAALQLAAARRKLELKWPGRGGEWIADPAGAEMATSEAAARHKSSRFARILGAGSAVVDLCCGIGADSVGLQDAGLAVTAVDSDPSRAWMAGRNAGCASLAADAADPSLPPGAFHLDPARRDGESTQRLWQIDDHRPGPSSWRMIIERRKDGAIKLGPGLDIAAACRVLPQDAPHEVEIISERGRLTQALLWIGRLAAGRTGARTATALSGGSATTLTAAPGEIKPEPIGPLRRYLIECDASIERTGLLGVVCARDGRATGVHAGLGLLTSDAPYLLGPAMAGMFTPFEVVARMPWIERNIRTWLHQHDGGLVEVKTRGRVVDPDVVQKHLRGDGSTRYAVFVLRLGRAIEAFITRRVPRPGA